MARCRSIKPGFMTNELLPELGAHAHLLFAGLWMVADREGRLEDRPKKIKAECLPHYEIDVDALLSKLASGEDPFIRRYTVGANKYIQILKWKNHQSPHHTEKPSVIPEFSLSHGEVTVSSLPSGSVHTTSNQLPVTSEEATSNQKPEGDAMGRRATPFVPPTVDQVRSYCRERSNHVDPEKFVDFYASKGWMIGKNKMQDWKAAVRTWEGSSNGSRGSPKARDPRGNFEVLGEFLAEGDSNGEP